MEPNADPYNFVIEKTIDIDASVADTFASVLDQCGPGSSTPAGPMPMVLEPWPGGRWFRDLGNNSGHLWGHVQVIKPPKLLEITGPLFVSAAVMSHLQYRLAEKGDGCTLSLTHRMFGAVPDEFRTGAVKGFTDMLERIRRHATRQPAGV